MTADMTGFMEGDKELIKEIVDKIRLFADNKKAEDITVLDIGAISSIADFFVIASGNNEKHVSAIAESIEDELSKLGVEPKSVEGLREGRWVVMDYFNIIVHIFHKDMRYHYNLERVWNDSERTIYE
jgi:ribosome-associated protein